MTMVLRSISNPGGTPRPLRMLAAQLAVSLPRVVLSPNTTALRART